MSAASEAEWARAERAVEHIATPLRELLRATPGRVFEGLPPEPSYREFAEWCSSHYRRGPTRVALDVGDPWRYPPRLCPTPRCTREVPSPTRPGRRVVGWICGGCGRFLPYEVER